MASTPEGKVKDKIKAIVKDRGMYVMPYQQGMGSNGVSDFLVVMDGEFVAIEAKAGKGKPTELQKRFLAKVVAHGGVALVVNESWLARLEAAVQPDGTVGVVALRQLVGDNRKEFGW